MQDFRTASQAALARAAAPVDVVSLSARASAIRGDDYQHTIGWYWACKMLCNPDIVSVSIEDASGGAFDDVVIRRLTGPDTYIQVKSSTSGDKVGDINWLTTPATARGRSPLQHFFATFLQLSEGNIEFRLEMWTNRRYDDRSGLFGKFFDNKSEKVRTDALLSKSNGSKAGKERKALAMHLGVEVAQLAAFLDKVCWKTTGGEDAWRQHARPLMELAGLRSDEQAINSGVSLVRSWVTDGKGPQSTDDVRAAVAERDLLAVSGTLVLVVNGIDREPTPMVPTVVLDFVDLYEGEGSFTRKLFLDRSEWDTTVRPALDDAVRALKGYGVRHVHVGGSMRHPMWFMVGRSLPEVKKWTLSVEQVGTTWRTDEELQVVRARTLTDVELGAAPGVAVGLGLTSDPSENVERFLRMGDLDVGRLLVYGPGGEPSRVSVPSGAWAMTWARSVRDQVRAIVPDAQHVHVFMQCPAGVALMLGHQWNLMPDTTMYEFVGNNYHPTVTVPGV